MRVGLYCRVSTSDQTLDPQLDVLRRYVKARGWEPREFTDHARSGRSRERPGLDALLSAARRREIDAVLVAKLDRLGRSLSHLLAVLGELEGIALDDGIDSQTAAGRLFMQMRGAFAEYEAGIIRERTLAGLAAARRRGARIGRPRRLDAAARRRLSRLRAHGHSLRQCARILNCGLATVSRELSRG
jgi:DNA invertase Pin-like site-specific DNA recombinase